MTTKNIQVLLVKKYDGETYDGPTKVFKMFLEETSLHGWKYLVPMQSNCFSSMLMLLTDKLECLFLVNLLFWSWAQTLKSNTSKMLEGPIV
jgi:hypothetical protein